MSKKKLAKGLVDVIKNRKADTPKDDVNFLKLQETKGGRERAAAKVKLQSIIRNEDLPKNKRDKAERTLSKMEKADEAAEQTRRIKQSQTQRSKKPVTLAGIKQKETPTKISFVDEETGEVFEISKTKYESMTTNQKNAMLRNFKARSRLGEDLSDKGMAKQRSRVAANAKKVTRKQKGGGLNKKPRGCGAAQRGFGKVMK